ncbi:MAG: thioredoxin family protein [Bacteroidota bacterium]
MKLKIDWALALLLSLGCSAFAATPDKPRLLELGADRCVPCTMMQPILAELKKEYAGKVRIDFIDVWKNPEEARRYRVRSIPTQVFFDRKGQEVFRHLGFYSKDAIVRKLKEMGVR